MGIILTVDYESDWGGRVKSIAALEKTTGPLLAFLDKAGVRITFFISTEIADRAEGFLRSLSSAGHEIASHGHDHCRRYDMLSRREFHHQAKQSKEILENIVGKPVLGFRTPQFRKNPHTEEVLVELGYRYDSSNVSTGLPGRYKKNQHSGRALPEFPVAALHRCLPAGLKWVNLFGGLSPSQGPTIIYAHPFDLLSAADTFRFLSRETGLPAFLFYMARIGSPFHTLKKLPILSKTLCSCLPGDSWPVDTPWK